MHRTQTDHVCTLYHSEYDHVQFDLPSRETYAKHQRWSKSDFTFDQKPKTRPHSLAFIVTLGHNYFSKLNC